VGTVLVSLLSIADPGPALGQDPDQALHDWQLRRLMQPSPRELEKEHSGSVYIYDGLTEQEVVGGLNKHFDRIQPMMFVGTGKTDTSGQRLTDASTPPSLSRNRVRGAARNDCGECFKGRRDARMECDSAHGNAFQYSNLKINACAIKWLTPHYN